MNYGRAFKRFREFEVKDAPSKMRTSALYYLVLMLATAVTARYTTRLDNSSEQETTPLVDGITSTPRSPEEATGEEDADALGNAFYQVAQGLLLVQKALHQQEQNAERRTQETLRVQEQRTERRAQEALRLHEQVVERKVQEALRLQEQEAERKLQEALRLHAQEVERKVQEALRLYEQETERKVQEALRLQEEEAERRTKEALRLQEQRAATASREAVRQMDQQLQERDEAVRALRHTLDERMQRVEARLGNVEVQTNTISKKVEDVAAERQLSRNHLESRLINLEAAVQRIVDYQRLDTPVRQQAEPEIPTPSPATSLRESHTFPSSFISSTSISTMAPTAAATEAAAPADEERERRWLERRLQRVRARRDRARAAPSPLGEDLCTAAFEGRAEDVRRLLDAGADVNYTSSHGTTPLISAFYLPYQWHNAKPDVLSLLLERGAYVNAIDSNGWSALHYAAEYDTGGGCVAVLLGAGANVNARDDDGATPLHRVLGLWYLWSENEAIARTLLSAGANRRLRCWSGWWMNMTPLDVAESVAADAFSARDLLRLLHP